MGTLHEELYSDFYSEAQPIQLPEPSWRDAEDFALSPGQTEETEQETEQRETAERVYVVRRQLYADLDEQLLNVVCDEDVFAISPSMSKELRAFRSVISSYVRMRNLSVTKSGNYSGAGHGTRKAYKPTRLDFFADVQVVAKKALILAPKLWEIFKTNILEHEGETWAQVPMKLRAKIEERVGKQFHKTGLYPVGAYFS